MPPAKRLPRLIEALRRHRRPVTAATLAAELSVSLRTVQGDLQALAEQGAPVEKEAELGYVLKPGLFVAPLMLTDDELDAVLLGLRLVHQRGDDLADAADVALAKVAASLPAEPELKTKPRERVEPRFRAVHRAIEQEEKLRLRYGDKKGAVTERIVWPVAISGFEGHDMLAAWDELRSDFRHFRLDRIVFAEATGVRCPERRRVLLAGWRAASEWD